MKHLFPILLLASLLLNCKKEEDTPEPEPQPAPTGKIALTIQTFDSLGQLQNNHSGVRVVLDGAHTATTDVNGRVQFEGLSYGGYYPSLVRDNFEGPPFEITLNQAQATSTIPCVQRSPFKPMNFTAQTVTKDSIIINFTLDTPIPAGKKAQVALIAGTDNGLSANYYLTADLFFTTTNSVNKLNIANFARFKNLVASLDSNAIYFINVVPVSYGEYESNLVVKPLLLGDNLFAPDNWLLKKEWK